MNDCKIGHVNGEGWIEFEHVLFAELKLSNLRVNVCVNRCLHLG